VHHSQLQHCSADLQQQHCLVHALELLLLLLLLLCQSHQQLQHCLKLLQLELLQSHHPASFCCCCCWLPRCSAAGSQLCNPRTPEQQQ
jgi:hypothetical protein